MLRQNLKHLFRETKQLTDQTPSSKKVLRFIPPLSDTLQKATQDNTSGSPDINSAVNYAVKKTIELRHQQWQKSLNGLTHRPSSQSEIPLPNIGSNQRRNYTTGSSDLTTSIHRDGIYAHLEDKNLSSLFHKQREHYNEYYTSDGRISDLIKNEKLTFGKIEEYISKKLSNLVKDTKVVLPIENLEHLKQFIADGNFESCKTKSEKVRELFDFHPIIGYLSIRDDGTFQSKSVILDGKLHKDPLIAKLAHDGQKDSNNFFNPEISDDPGAIPNFTDDDKPMVFSNLNETNTESPIIIILKDTVKNDTTITLGKADDCKEHQKGPVPLTEPNINFFPLIEQGFNISDLQDIEDSPAKIQAQIIKENLALNEIAQVRFRKGSGVTKESSEAQWFKNKGISVVIEEEPKLSKYHHDFDDGWE